MPLIKLNKKGFTFVELIAVLAILATLAAIMVPSLTGYIDKAKDTELITT
ncbi:MAG: type IV pilin protein [Erysipelotrichaceae bacterium]|nr:prepilin-type N-terminal cleavage/methylation domain-containing protein [Erysipelotrichaceae bacterium]